MFIVRLISLSILSVLAVAVPATASDPIIQFEFTPENNRIGVDVEFGGQTLHMLLDTGASTTVFFEKVRPLLQPFDSGETRKVLFPAVNSTIEARPLEEIKLELHGHKLPLSRAVLLTDKNNLKTQLMLSYDGILGQEFFQRYAVEVNPDTHVLRLYSAGTDLSQLYRVQRDLYMQGSAPHIRFRTRLPWEKSPSMKEMLLDTGYPGAMILWTAEHYRGAKAQARASGQERADGHIATRANFRFGRLNFNNTPVFILSKEPSYIGQRDGVIGGNILNHFRYAIDLQSQKLWIMAKNSTQNFMQVIDSNIYPPNDEDFVVQDATKKPVGSNLRQVIK